MIELGVWELIMIAWVSGIFGVFIGILMGTSKYRDARKWK